MGINHFHPGLCPEKFTGLSKYKEIPIIFIRIFVGWTCKWPIWPMFSAARQQPKGPWEDANVTESLASLQPHHCVRIAQPKCGKCVPKNIKKFDLIMGLPLLDIIGRSCFDFNHGIWCFPWLFGSPALGHTGITGWRSDVHDQISGGKCWSSKNIIRHGHKGQIIHLSWNVGLFLAMEVKHTLSMYCSTNPLWRVSPTIGRFR